MKKLVVVEVLLNELRAFSLQLSHSENSGKEEYSCRINVYKGVLFQCLKNRHFLCKLCKYSKIHHVSPYTPKKSSFRKVTDCVTLRVTN